MKGEQHSRDYYIVPYILQDVIRTTERVNIVKYFFMWSLLMRRDLFNHLLWSVFQLSNITHYNMSIRPVQLMSQIVGVLKKDL